MVSDAFSAVLVGMLSIAMLVWTDRLSESQSTNAALVNA